MIQSIMLAALGFIAASLLALLIAPAFWARAVRLTNQRLRSALPISEQEIRADKDLLRAEYALKVHQLEREVELGRLAAHRQQIEINRRDIEIRRLAETLAGTQANLGEHRNARSVLEQTVTERIPVLEQSLSEARTLLQARDAAVNELQATADRQAAALEDGRAILTQRALEVQRLQSLFQEASASGRGQSDGGADSLSLRAEVESLKARLAERAAVINRLQGEVGARPRVATLTASASLLDGATSEQMRALISEQAAEIVQLRQDIEAGALPGAASALPPEDRELAARHLQSLETQLRDQANEIARLRAENEAISQAGDPAANARVHDSKVWLRMRIERLQSDLDRQHESTGRIRAELAAANERIARQGMHYRDEFKRQGNRVAIPAADILRDAGPSEAAPSQKAVASNSDLPVRRPAVSTRARELQRALQGHFGGDDAAADVLAAADAANDQPPAEEAGAQPSEAAASSDVTTEGGTRGRLLDRLKSYEQA